MGTAAGAGRFETFFTSARGQRLVGDIRKRAPRGEGEDLAQDVLAWAWSRWATFHNDDHVVNGCLHHAERRAIDRARKASRRENPRRDFAEHELGVAEDPAETVERREACRPRWEAFASLSPASQAMLLAVANDENYDDLAHRLAVSPGAFRVRLHRVRAALKAAQSISNASTTSLAIRAHGFAERLKTWRPSAPFGRAAVLAALVAMTPRTVGAPPAPESARPTGTARGAVTSDMRVGGSSVPAQVRIDTASTFHEVRRHIDRRVSSIHACVVDQCGPAWIPMGGDMIRLHTSAVTNQDVGVRQNVVAVCGYVLDTVAVSCQTENDPNYYLDRRHSK